MDLEQFAQNDAMSGEEQPTEEQLKTLNFKSKGGYKKWLAYGHMHVPDFGKGKQRIKIAGKTHKVKHSKK
jgi:hypothetical protein